MLIFRDRSQKTYSSIMGVKRSSQIAGLAQKAMKINVQRKRRAVLLGIWLLMSWRRRATPKQWIGIRLEILSSRSWRASYSRNRDQLFMGIRIMELIPHIRGP